MKSDTLLRIYLAAKVKKKPKYSPPRKSHNVALYG